MNHHITKIALTLLLPLLGTTGCDNRVRVPEVPGVGPDAITEISLSPESPVLIADGKAELTFLVRCYYQVGKTKARMLEGRLPLDKITITSSEGKTIKATDPYTTTTDRETLSFTAKIGDITSTPITVHIYPATDTEYDPIIVPVRIYAFYEPQNATAAQGITLEVLQPHFRRLSDVFSGKLDPNSPTGASAGITFDLKEVKKIALKESSEFKPVKEQVRKKYLANAANEISIWIMDGRIGWKDGIDYCVPSITTGDPNNSPDSISKKSTHHTPMTPRQ